MRVISKEKDYYDNIGFNSNYPVFVRKTQKLHPNKDGVFVDLDSKENKVVNNVLSSIRYPYIIRKYDIKVFAVHVCGYTKLIIYRLNKSFDNKKNLIEYLLKNVKGFKKDLGLYTKSFYVPFYYNGITSFNIFNDDIFNKWEKEYNTNTLNKLMYKFDSPIFMFDIIDKCIIINPILKDIGFQSLIDPYTMHQKIDMCLSNELVKEKDIPEFNDILKRDMHGMNKWSFKKKKVK